MGRFTADIAGEIGRFAAGRAEALPQNQDGKSFAAGIGGGETGGWHWRGGWRGIGGAWGNESLEILKIVLKRGTRLGSVLLFFFMRQRDI